MQGVRDRDELDDIEGFSLKPREFVEILWRRRALFVQVFLFVGALGIFFSRGGAPLYRAEARVNSADPSYQFNIINSSDPFAGIMTAAEGEGLSAQLQALQSAEVQEEARKAAEIRDLPNVPGPSVSVTADPADGIIVIGVVGGDPEQVARLANAMAELHIERTVERNEAGLRRAINFLKDGQAKAEVRLRQAQAKLAAFNNRYRLSELTQEREQHSRRREALEARVADLTAAIAAASAELADLDAAYRTMPAEELVHQTRPNPVADRLQQQLDDLRFKRESLLVERTEGSREVWLVDQQINQLRERLDGVASTRSVQVAQPNSERKAVEAQIREAKRSLNKLQRERGVVQAQLEVAKDTAERAAEVVRGREFDQQRLVGEREAAKAALEQFTSRLQDLELRKIARVETARIVSRAVPPKAAMPTNRTTTWATVVIAAAIVGIVAVFVRETFDDRLIKTDDLQKLTEQPVLVHVPRIEGVAAPLISLLPSHSPAGEAYRSLRFSLRLAMAQNPFKKLLVTSPSEGEGKTVTAVNLSIALALEGWRVILVDGDLRRPNVHRLLELPNDTGLSEILAGLVPLEHSFRNPGINNLRVITAGPTPHNPSELLGGTMFEALTNKLSEMADVVIFDSPPCLPVTDPLLIGEQAGAVILVVQAGQTRKEAIRQALGHLGRVNARLLGLVVNKVSRGQGYYGYHTYYGYSSFPSSPGSQVGGGAVSAAGAGSKDRWPRFSRRPDKTHRE